MKKLSQLKEKFKNPAKKKKSNPKQNYNREIRFSREKVRKGVTITIFMVIFLSLFFNILFFSKYQTIRNGVEASQEKVEEQLQQLENRKEGFTDSVISFGEDFLDVYYNVPESKKERDERVEQLANYYVNGFKISELESLEDFQGERLLDDIRYLETEYVGANKVNLVYEVSYTINEIKTVEKEVKKKKKTKVVEEEEEHSIKDSVQVVVPVVTDGEGYAVYEKPSLTSRDFISDISIDETPLVGEDISTTDREQLQDFLHDFFTSYGVSDEKLPFMGDVQNGLDGQIFTDLVLKQVAINDNGDYQIIVDVVYQPEETSFKSMYTYYLVASKANNKYFIEDIKQGGF